MSVEIYYEPICCLCGKEDLEEDDIHHILVQDAQNVPDRYVSLDLCKSCASKLLNQREDITYEKDLKESWWKMFSEVNTLKHILREHKIPFDEDEL